MVLDTAPLYPSDRAYVLKLHRDATPGSGRIFGRLENLASGEHFLFANAEELLECLIHAEARRRTT
jgi:hypothetical protein